MEIKDRRTPSAGTVAKKHGISMSRLEKQLAIGAKIEREHTHSVSKAREIARDHLAEIPDYYTRLKKMEKRAKSEIKEMASSGSQSFDEFRKAQKISPQQQKRFATAYKKHKTDDFDHAEGVFPSGISKKERGPFVAWKEGQDQKNKEQHKQRVAEWKKRTPLHKRVLAAVKGKHPGIKYGRKGTYGIAEYDDELERLHNANRERILKGGREGKYWLLRSEEREALIDRIIETTTSGSIGSYNMGLGVPRNDDAMNPNRVNKRNYTKAVRELLATRGSLAP